MRLTDHQIAVIKSTAREIWGAQVQVRLFGSRVDDNRRGGDIDLYVSGVTLPAEEQLQTKLRFLVRLKQLLGDQRIDVVFAPVEGEAVLPIQRMAQATGVLL